MNKFKFDNKDLEMIVDSLATTIEEILLTISLDFPPDLDKYVILSNTVRLKTRIQEAIDSPPVIKI